MVYKIFTDGSCSEADRTITSGFIVLTQDGTYITSKAYAYEGTDSVQAETVALGLAAEYVLKSDFMNPVEDKILLITDCLASRTYIGKAIQQGGIRSSSELVEVAVKNILKLNETYDLKIEAVKAHIRNKVTPNTFADRMVRTVLRDIVIPREECLQ